MDRIDDSNNPYATRPTPSAPKQGLELVPGQEPVKEPKPFFSGDTIVAIVLGIGIFGAFAGWLWHYEYRRVPQTFWGFESPKIFREAKEVTAYLIRPEGTGVTTMPQYYDTLFMIDELRFVVVKKLNVANDQGLPRVREMLNEYKNYQKSYATWSNPNWRFVLEFHWKAEKEHELGDYTAVIVFDDECKLGRPQTVNKVIATDPMSEELKAYFEKIFPEAKDLKTTVSTNVFARPLVEEPESTPTATATATGDIPSATLTTQSEALTTPHPVPTATGPATFGPATPNFEQPSTGAFAVPAPAPAPSASATPTAAAAAKPPEPSGPSVFSTPPKVGPAVVPQMPGIPGLPNVGGPAGVPLVPAAPAAPGGLNINLNGPLNPPTSPLYQGAPSPGGLNNLTQPTPITVPALQGGPKPSGTK